MNKPLRLPALAALLMLSACTTVPTGPGVLALPGTGRSFDEFRNADYDCRQFAIGQVGGSTANQAAVESGVKSAALGATVGALAGAAMNGQQGAGSGAGLGLLIGGATGVEAGQASAYGSQQRYDNAYIQCMYAKGHRVPVTGRLLSGPTGIVNPPATGYTLPPPPPGIRR